MEKKLIVLSEFVDPSRNSTGYYWSKLIQGFSVSFPGITVLCPEESYSHIPNPTPSVSYRCFKGSKLKSTGVFSRLLKQLLMTLRMSVLVFRSVKRGDVVFSGTNPSFMLLLLAIFKRFCDFKWVLLSHDVFPDNLSAAGVMCSNSLGYKLLGVVFRRCYRSADSIIAIGRDMESLFRQKVGVSSEVVYIPNWVDVTDVSVGPRDEASRLLSEDVSSKVVFQFFGNIGRVQGIDNLLSAISMSVSKNAIFLFIGGGAAAKKVINVVNSGSDPRIKYVESLAFEHNNRGLSCCDIAMVSLASGMNGLGVPSKAYFSLAAGKPLLVVTDNDSELHKLIKEEPETGWHVPAGEPVELAKVIDSLCISNNIDREKVCRQVVQSKFEYKLTMPRYESVVGQYFE